MLLLLLWFLIRLPSVQNYAKDKIMTTLSEQYNAEWSIDDINIKFIDEVEAEGILFMDQQGDTLFSADKLYIDIGLFSFFNKEILIDDIRSQNANINIYELQNGKMNFDFLIPEADPNDVVPDTKSSTWTYGVETINLNSTKVRYTTPEIKVNVNQKLLKVELNALDISNQKIDIEELISDGTKINLESSSSSESSSSGFTLPDLGWTIAIDDTQLVDSDLIILSDKPTKISGLDIKLKNSNYTGDTLSTSVLKVGGTYNDLIKLTEANGEIQLNGSTLNLQKIKINTETDRISIGEANLLLTDNSLTSNSIDIDLSYATISEFKAFIPKNIQIIENQKLVLNSEKLTYSPNNLFAKNIKLKYGEAIDLLGSINVKTNNRNFSQPDYFDANLKRFSTEISKLDFILVDVKVPDSLSRYDMIEVTGRASGNLESLVVEDFSLQVDEVLNAKATGTISHISNPEILSYDLSFTQLDADVRQLPIPANNQIAIDSLGIISYKGNISGDTKSVKIDGNLNSSIGALEASMDLDFGQGITKLKYKGDLTLKAFDLGVFLKNPELQKITITTQLDGQGIQLQDISSKLKGEISDFTFRGYTFATIGINAKVNNGNIDGKINVNDPNVKFNYDGIINISDDNTTFDFEADIDTINFHALELYQDSISMSGKIKSQFSLPLSTGDKGNVTISDLSISNPSETFTEDSILISATRTVDSTFIAINGDAMELYMDGVFSIRDLPSSINELANQYFSTDTIIDHIDRRSKSLHLYGKVNTLRPIDVILRESLTQTKLITLDINADFDSKALGGSIVIDSFYYTDIFSEKIVINIDSDNNKLDIDINGSNNTYKDIAISSVDINNSIKNNIIFSTLLAKDDDALPRLKFSTETTRQDSILKFVMQDSVILNNENWIVSNDNSILLQNGEIIVNDFELTDKNEYLTINSSSQDGNDLDINFENFNIGQFITLLTSEKSQLSGTINGDVEIKDLNRDIPYYIVNLQVENIVYDSTNVGVLKVKANADPQSSLIYSDLSLKGESNDVVGSGNFNTDNNSFDFTLDVNAFELKLVDPFLSEIISDSEGTLSGSAELKGTPQLPDISGDLTMNKVVTTIVANNSRYGIDEHTLYFDNERINIGILDIFDADNNIATLTGSIYHTKLQNVDIDLVVETSKFTFLNTSAKDNPVFYGKVMLDAVGDITGPPDLLNVDFIATSLEDSDITISPFSAESILQEEDFITYGKPEDFEDLTNEYLLKLAQQYPFNVNLLLETNKDASLTFVVDPLTGDKIKANGNGSLRIKLNPDGEQEIYGTYTVDDGFYNFSYGDFVTKEFNIASGGSVTFNGNPLAAILDIDAVYNVYTSPFPLLSQQSFNSASEEGAAKARTNVNVYLSLNGTLENPEIGLDIKIPELQSSTLTSPVDLRLNQLRSNPNELNTQVFGLLIFDSFLIQDNNSSGFGSIGGNIALSSVSNLISNQLNNLAQDIIKGVDFNFNVNSYDSNYINDGAGGNVTELGLQVTKQLFNDRLSISATGNIDLEENKNSQSGPYSSFLGDFVLEYKLTQDGKYRVRVFSKTDHDRITTENTNKNGVSLYFKKSFDSKNKQQN